ncbi:MAG TPA: AAA family ATPase [Solirubrobacteraceae bacterium]|nr:AAA family ATPase [Solirubrobacteraceae bacterium]
MSAQPSRVATAATRTRIELAGTLRAQIDGRELAARLPGRQGRALFAFLVVNRHRPVRRAELIDVLWPGEPPEAPEAGLSTVLARVRRALGEGVVEGRAELRIVLGDDADIDVERAMIAAQDAERALAAGDPDAARAAAETALEILERPLLPGIEGAWVDGLRGELAAHEPGLLEVLARAALDLGDREHLALAERAARTLAERHPFRESGHALLIEIHGRRGNVAEATLAYDRLRVFLRDELGTVPSRAVSALHEQLLRSGRLESPGAAPAPPRPARAGSTPLPLPVIGGVPAATPFVGREEHLQRLRTAWLEAGTGQRRLALLVGEAGVGKTRLAARFAGEVHGAGGAVLYGRCDEEPLRSYQPFIEALRHELRHGSVAADPGAAAELHELARILPEARSAGAGGPPPAQDAESERYRLFEAVAGLLRRAAERAPLLLVVDDLHWSDRPTLLLLRHLLRHPDPARLMVLGLVRDVEVGDDHPLTELIADLRRERRLDRVALAGLSEREADALVAARLSAAPSAGFVRGLHEQTQGNAFFIEEALRALVEARVLEAGAEAQPEALESIGVPESVAEVILHRLARVSARAREALTIGATAGAEFDLAIVEALLDAPAEQVIEALEEAIASGLVVEVADAVDRFAFCHALARDAIYGRLSRARRLRLHLRVARALEAAGAGAAELAHHFFAAREVGAAAQAVSYAARAGEEAAESLAYEDSVEHYRRALQAIAVDPGADEARRCEILLALGRVQWRGGDAAARASYLEAAASARERGAAEQLGRAALGLAERYWEASAADRWHAELIAEAVRALPAQDSPLRARLMGRMAENLHFSAEQGYGTQLSAEALAMARRLGDRETLVMALMSRHVTLLHIAHLDERVALSDELLALTGQHRALRAEALHWRLLDVCELGALEAARRDHAELAAIARDLRQPLLEHLAVGWLGAFAHLAGDVEAARRHARRSFELAARAQVGHADSYLAGMLFTLRRQQGRVGELLPSIEALAGGGSARLAWQAALALAQVETGAVEAGRERFEELSADGARAVPRDWFWFLTVVLLAETCCALGDGERAAQLYELLAPYAERYVQVIFTANWGSAQRPLGMLAATAERFDVAEEHFRAALLANRRLDAVLMTAQTQCEYGAMLLRRRARGDREHAAVLASLAEQVAAPRALEGLRMRAHELAAEAGR